MYTIRKCSTKFYLHETACIYVVCTLWNIFSFAEFYINNTIHQNFPERYHFKKYGSCPAYPKLNGLMFIVLHYSYLIYAL